MTPASRDIPLQREVRPYLVTCLDTNYELLCKLEAVGSWKLPAADGNEVRAITGTEDELNSTSDEHPTKYVLRPVVGVITTLFATSSCSFWQPLTSN